MLGGLLYLSCKQAGWICANAAAWVVRQVRGSAWKGKGCCNAKRCSRSSGELCCRKRTHKASVGSNVAALIGLLLAGHAHVLGLRGQGDRSGGVLSPRLRAENGRYVSAVTALPDAVAPSPRATEQESRAVNSEEKQGPRGGRSGLLVTRAGRDGAEREQQDPLRLTAKPREKARLDLGAAAWVGTAKVRAAWAAGAIRPVITPDSIGAAFIAANWHWAIMGEKRAILAVWEEMLFANSWQTRHRYWFCGQLLTSASHLPSHVVATTVQMFVAACSSYAPGPAGPAWVQIVQVVDMIRQDFALCRLLHAVSTRGMEAQGSRLGLVQPSVARALLNKPVLNSFELA